ncbi:MlrC C-terminal domain-containing protein [Treponema sp. OMZ 790]|uniref:MlrC C-terminal domain-containing protein n=1 Tax=Treponema sp. OMZ 790 TaxID=2563665 RepID=UPI0020A547CF|nr:MlrC C-terminal domain-containing protein [Treponema sp. OMZ 790]
MQNKEGPVFVSDSGDNPYSRFFGDSTECFEALLKQKEALKALPTKVLYSGFFDKAAVEKCFEAGEGSSLEITIGGTWDKINGKKIPCPVKVLKLVKNYGVYDSRLAFVEMEDIRIVLTSNHIGFGDDELLPAGCKRRRLLYSYRKAGLFGTLFSKIAKRAILAESKGCSNEVLETLITLKLASNISLG